MVDNPSTATKSVLVFLGGEKVDMPATPRVAVTAVESEPVRPSATCTGIRIFPLGDTVWDPGAEGSGVPEVTPFRGTVHVSLGADSAFYFPIDSSSVEAQVIATDS